MRYFNAIALIGVVLGSGISSALLAGEPERICNKAKLPEIDFYTCEGDRLRDKGQALLRQARVQITEGNRITADCERLEDQEAARDCNLLSSDMIEDAAFKQAEAGDLLEEAARMDARAADRGKRRR